MAGVEEALPPVARGSRPGALPGWVAAVVTFLCSGVVLVLEISGLRLIAPFVGIKAIDLLIQFIPGISCCVYLPGSPSTSPPCGCSSSSP